MSLQPVFETQSIKFFDDNLSCISHFEKMHWTKKAISLIQSFGTLFIYALNKIIFALCRVGPRENSLAKVKEFSKQRLVVCIHGLNSNPTQFKKIIDEIQISDRDSKTDIFIPCVLNKGNAPLDEMVKPIFEEIAKWAETSGDKELVLVGISNGARIARAIEVEIAKSKKNANIKKLHFISIVGACKGSSLANLANKVGLSWLMSKSISKEMPTTSNRNKQLNTDWEKMPSTGPTRKKYTFIASPHDWQVTNYDSSLMQVLEKNAYYAIVPSHGHNSIVNAVSKPVVEIIFNSN